MYEQSAILALERPGNRENSGVLRTKQHFARMAMNDTELRGQADSVHGCCGGRPRRSCFCLRPRVGLAYLSMGRFKEARSIFEEAFANSPNNPAGYMLKAIADVELGRDDDAR